MQFNKDRELSEWLDDIKMLGNLYDFTVPDSQKSQLFHDILDKFDNLTEFSDPTLRILEVSTLYLCFEVVFCFGRFFQYPLVLTSESLLNFSVPGNIQKFKYIIIRHGG